MPNRKTQKRIIKRAALRNDVNPAILWGLYGAETNFGKNKNVSSAGAQGPFQFMPATAASYGIDPHNFRQAANAAAKYLSQYKDRGVAGMLAAYNAGPAGNPNNPETQAYIPRVKQLARTWDDPGGGGGGERRRDDPRSDRRSSRPDTYEVIPGVDNSALRQQAMLGYLAERGKPGSLLELKGSLDAAQDVPDQSVRIPGQKVVRQGGNKPNRTNGPAVARPNALENIEAEMELINAAKVPYQWGGGHAAKQKRGSKVVPLDCSGAVSRVLGIDPRVSGQFESWGKPGKGKAITIYANEGHVLMSRKDKNGVEHFWGTSGTNPGGGAGWIKRKDISQEYLSAFTARHPRGL